MGDNAGTLTGGKAGPVLAQTPPSDPPTAPPTILLAQIQIGPKLTLLTQTEQLMILHMCADRAFKHGELSPTPTADELHSLAEECEGLAEARVAAAAKISSIGNPYQATNPDVAPARGRTSKVNSRWAVSGPLQRLELAISSSSEAPRHFHDAIKCKLYIPLNMFTFSHLETIAMTAKQTRWVDPDSGDKIFVPDTASFINLEGTLSKSEWEEGYRNFIPVVRNACGPDMADMFTRWHSLCQTHHLYRNDNDFIIILRFDISIRKQFFLKTEPFELGEYLFAGTNGIQRFAYEVQNERNATALAAATASPAIAPYSGGPDRQHKPRGGYPRNPSFPPSSRGFAASLGCCARCGRKSHRARDCSEDKLSKGGAISCDYKDGRFITRDTNKELCFRYNTGTGWLESYITLFLC